MSATRSLDQVRGKVEQIAGPGVTIDLDMMHAMTARDNALVADEALSGTSGAFTYSFNLAGTMVQGVSVIGARHLAALYGGLKHRLVASIDKNGPRFVFTTYPGGGVSAMDVRVAVIEDMAQEPDFYTVVVEISDIKTGLMEQVEITESRMERKSRKNKKEGDPDEWYERPHFRRIAQSKAFRNGVLNVLPQDLVMKFKQQSLDQGKNTDLTKDWLEEIRDNLLRYATGQAIPVNRLALATLDSVQLQGLRDAVKNGREAFIQALAAAGCIAQITPMREIPMEHNLGEVVNLNPPKQAEVVPIPGAPVTAAQVAEEHAGEAGRVAAEQRQGEPQGDAPPPVTNQGTSVRRVDLSDPPAAMKVWVETYGVEEARRLAAKQDWVLPPELVPQREGEDPGPPTPPYEGEVRRGTSGDVPARQREARTAPRGEAKAGGRRAGDAPDLFPGDDRGKGR